MVFRLYQSCGAGVRNVESKLRFWPVVEVGVEVAKKLANPTPNFFGIKKIFSVIFDVKCNFWGDMHFFVKNAKFKKIFNLEIRD